MPEKDEVLRIQLGSRCRKRVHQPGASRGGRACRVRISSSTVSSQHEDARFHRSAACLHRHERRAAAAGAGRPRELDAERQSQHPRCAARCMRPTPRRDRRAGSRKPRIPIVIRRHLLRVESNRRASLVVDGLCGPHSRAVEALYVKSQSSRSLHGAVCPSPLLTRRRARTSGRGSRPRG